MAVNYDKNTDYAALMKQAADQGEYDLAALYEQKRNAKIQGEGLNYSATSQYANYLPAKQTTSFSPDMTAYNDAYNNLLNFKDFSYDYSTDPLYSQYRKQYTREGQRAGADALASGAAATGGMVSSYAQTAANQAQNYYAAQLTDKIPELYQLAYNKYMQDFTMAQNQLTAAANDYNRQYTEYQDQIAQQNTDYANQLEFAQLAAGVGDYSYLQNMGIDTSAMTATTGKGGSGTPVVEETVTGYPVSTAMWKQISDEATGDPAKAAQLLVDNWNNLSTSQRNILARKAGYSSADIVKNGSITQEGATALNSQLGQFIKTAEPTTEETAIGGITNHEDATKLLSKYGVTATPLTKSQWDATKSKSQFSSYTDYLKAFVDTYIA